MLNIYEYFIIHFDSELYINNFACQEYLNNIQS